MRNAWLVFIFVALVIPVAAYSSSGGDSAPDTGVIGSLDAVSCSTGAATGWAQDEDAPAEGVEVFFWIDSEPDAYDSTEGSVGSVVANENRADLCASLGSCDHGFTFALPPEYLDGKQHKFYAYGQDTNSDNGTELSGVSKKFTCEPPPSCSVTFDQNPINYGDSTTARWNSQLATSMYINNIGYVTPNVTGSVTVTGDGDSSSCVFTGGQQQTGQGTVIALTSGTSWTVPDDWNSAINSVEVIGAGGGGGNNAGGGGGGGAYSKINNLSLTPGDSISYAIGSGGATQGAGGDTWFSGSSFSASLVGAKGGSGGSNGGSAGSGGSSTSGVGTTKYSGGDGGSGPSTKNDGGGGGGGAAGPGGTGKSGGQGESDGGGGGGGAGGGSSSAGSNANGDTGGAGGNGPSGTGGGARGSSGVAGEDGTNGGGGGGGSDAGGGGQNPGKGGNGTEWGSYGAGGGAGGASKNPNGASGGLYGGGGSASGEKASVGGTGGQGIVVITYTPVGGSAPTPVCYVDVDYSCTVEGADTSRTSVATLSVAAPPPPTVSISAASPIFPLGSSSTVTALFAGTLLDPLVSDDIDSPEGTGLGASTAPDASKVVNFIPLSTGIHTLFARAVTNFYITWQTFATTTVTVVDSPACTIDFSPDINPIPQGESTTISWSSSNADTFSINNVTGPLTPNTSGSVVVSPLQATDYTGTATALGYSVMCTDSSGTPPGTLSVSCTPSNTCNGTQTIVHTAADCVETTTACVVPAFCSIGSPVCLYPPPAFIWEGQLTGHLEARPLIIRPGDTSRLYWNVNYVDSCSVTDSDGSSWSGFSSVSGGQETNAISHRTVYTLTCQALPGVEPTSFTETVTIDINPVFRER